MVMNNSISSAAGTSYTIDLKHIKNNWIFGIGTGLTGLNENISMKTGNLLIKLTPYQKLDTIGKGYQVVNGDTIYENVTEYITYYQTDTTHLSSSYKNRYTFIEIPLSFGYTLPVWNVNFYLSGTLIPAIRIKNSKNVIASSDISLMYAEKKNTAAFALNYMISAGIIYPLNNKVHLSGGVMYRRNSSSLFKKEYNMSLDYYSLGVEFGIYNTF